MLQAVVCLAAVGLHVCCAFCLAVSPKQGVPPCRWQEGSCTFGDRCHFAHGQQEIRKLPPDLVRQFEAQKAAVQQARAAAQVAATAATGAQSWRCHLTWPMCSQQQARPPATSCKPTSLGYNIVPTHASWGWNWKDRSP